MNVITLANSKKRWEIALQQQVMVQQRKESCQKTTSNAEKVVNGTGTGVESILLVASGEATDFITVAILKA